MNFIKTLQILVNLILVFLSKLLEINTCKKRSVCLQKNFRQNFNNNFIRSTLFNALKYKLKCKFLRNFVKYSSNRSLKNFSGFSLMKTWFKKIENQEICSAFSKINVM